MIRSTVPQKPIVVIAETGRIHEPAPEAKRPVGSRVVNDLAAFGAEADLIVADRLTEEAADVADKVSTRDLSELD